MRTKRTRCQAFTVRLASGELVHGRGQFVGPLTPRDLDAIRDVAEALKRATKAESIESVSFTRVEPAGAGAK